MLAIQLERTSDGADGPRVGPVDALRIEGPSLRILPLNIELVRLIENHWRGDNENFIGLVIESKTLVYAEYSRSSKGRFYGPFEFLRVSHSTILSSTEGDETLACFNPLDGLWHVHSDDTHWPRLVLLPYGLTPL